MIDTIFIVTLFAAVAVITGVDLWLIRRLRNERDIESKYADVWNDQNVRHSERHDEPDQ